MSTFDVNAFENMVIEESNETKTTPVPEGKFPGSIDSQKIKTFKAKRGPREGQDLPILEVVYELADEDGKLKEILNRDKVTVRQDIWLDVNDNGGLAFGPNQNVALGRLREATGLNAPGRPFSFTMLEGQGPLMIHVTQFANPETGDVYNRVPKVEALG